MWILTPIEGEAQDSSNSDIIIGSVSKFKMHDCIISIIISIIIEYIYYNYTV